MSKTISPLYEINTAVYLERLSKEQQRRITLDLIPDEELVRLSDLGFKSIWLMGIWQRSPTSRQIALNDTNMMDSIKEILPDFKETDLIGSAYAIQNYEVNLDFGGKTALVKLRERLNDLGLKLILDFVPNHVAPDHPWVANHSDYFISGSSEDLSKDPTSYIKVDSQVLANGRDPTFPAWSDVIQVNAFSSGYRDASIATLSTIAGLCDGVRCDMAMLLLNRIFAKTWSSAAGPLPDKEYWQEIISAVHKKSSDFIFIAEAYWQTDDELIELGFNYCYDKRLYDHLIESDAGVINNYILHTEELRPQLMSFTENHDELRAASVFDEAKLLASLATVLTLPGLTLIYDGQIEGYKIKPPVHISRAPIEPINPAVYDQTNKLLNIIKNWPNSDECWHESIQSSPELLAWQIGDINDRHIVIINYSDNSLSYQFKLDENLPNKKFIDELTGQEISASSDSAFISLEMSPWQVYLLSFAS